MTLISFDDRDGHIWVNGDMVEWRDAKLHILSHGLHYSSSVFEGERFYNGNIFKLREHTDRLINSARILGFKIPYSADEIDAACLKLVEKSGVSNGYLRPIAWRGSEMMAISAQENKVNLAIAVWEWPSYFSAEAKMQGLKLQIAKWRRPSPDTMPTDSKAAGLYMICTLSKHSAERDGFNDALMLDYRGYIAESTGANIFFLMDDGKLHTPTADCFLNGITRRTAIDLAQKMGLEVVERHIKPEEMANATEAFLTGTAVEITPIASIDNYKFTPGKICKQLIDAYDLEVNNELIQTAAE